MRRLRPGARAGRHRRSLRRRRPDPARDRGERRQVRRAHRPLRRRRVHPAAPDRRHRARPDDRPAPDQRARLARLQGRAPGRPHDERLFRLGMGLLLPTSARPRSPRRFCTSRASCPRSEWEIVQTHPKAGVDLIRDTRLGARWSTPACCATTSVGTAPAIPRVRPADEIHEMARIAAVADVSTRSPPSACSRRLRPPHVGVQAILAGPGPQFDPTIIDVFSRRIVAPFPPGVEVALTDGRRAVVVSVSEHELDRPVVRVIGGPGAPSTSR